MHGFNAPHAGAGDGTQYDEVSFGEQTLDYNPERAGEHMLFEPVTVSR